MPTTIYHNPKCSTSRNTLGLIRNTGEEPVIVEYLKTPLSKEELRALVAKLDIPVRALLRPKEKLYAERDLGNPQWSDEDLLGLMAEHPILMNRPVVITAKGAKLCRPESEAVLDILEKPQRGAFAKEDGTRVVDEHGKRIQ
ncbi:MAG: arsenate reductase (glutaredoxin) [Proteobacteria bacterium]|nr:arsenate reductase (glutaredoxin) [Pseudomonadota bacterium]